MVSAAPEFVLKSFIIHAARIFLSRRWNSIVLDEKKKKKKEKEILRLGQTIFYVILPRSVLTNRLTRTLKLPPEKYNIKGLHVNSYITVGRRLVPKGSRWTIANFGSVQRKLFGLVSNVRLV